MSQLSARVFYDMSNDARRCLDADVEMLADHMHRCHHRQAPRRAMRRFARSLCSFTGHRFVSALVLAAAVLGGLSLLV